ncbi:unnamed protein product [Candida verbasci]|uniref:Pyridoxal phosphate homeostasis protein n=1 Tax=Candida verbasci TaxID=1227364 RepID=A0A9W4TSK2_9ASCO|nr:unnamed protein product [Candida verbasci]
MSTDRTNELINNYNQILSKVHSLNPNCKLVAVSKYKPSSDILSLYNHGVRHFGENYTQELISKAQELPKDIRWHFIGNLQSGKAKDLCKNVPNLYAIETIDSLKKCKQVNTQRNKHEGENINIFLQVNTSGEEQKSGYLKIEEIEETIEWILSDECNKLNLKGLMTIGSFTESTSGEENKDFKKLTDLKKELDSKYNLNLELSMGMSNDFEQAIKQGSTSVRVGSSIFGARLTKEEIKSN